MGEQDSDQVVVPPPLKTLAASRASLGRGWARKARANSNDITEGANTDVLRLQMSDKFARRDHGELLPPDLSDAIAAEKYARRQNRNAAHKQATSELEARNTCHRTSSRTASTTASV